MNDEYLDFNVGVPQGSSLGYSLWLLIINELLVKTKIKEYLMIAYADDIVVLMNSTATFHFTEKSKDPIREILAWCDKFHLQLSTAKCNLTLFKMGKRISHIPRIKINEVSINANELKYLGIIFDVNLPFIPHLNYLKEKIDKLIYNIARPTSGLKPIVIKNIYIV